MKTTATTATRPTLGLFRGPAKPRGLACRHCGQAGLEWRLQKNGKWRLYKIGGKMPHACPEFYDREEED